MSFKKENISCPTCNKPNTWIPENTTRPFCSERCKLIDLGAWAAEEHSIPGNDEVQTNHPDSTNENTD